MTVATKIPVTLKERLEHGEDFHIPASWEEFLDVLESCEYRIEYDRGEIISYMGYATELHEKLVGRILRLLGKLLDDEFFEVYPSNLAIYMSGTEQKYINADCSVIKGQPEMVALRGNMKAVSNPILIVEILSFSTRADDLDRKLKLYRNMPSVQQIIFIESTEVFVTNHVRYNGNGEWLVKDFYKKEDEVEVLKEGCFKLGDLYKKIEF